MSLRFSGACKVDLHISSLFKAFLKNKIEMDLILDIYKVELTFFLKCYYSINAVP